MGNYLGTNFESYYDESIYISSYFPHIVNSSINNNNRKVLAVYDFSTGQKLNTRDSLQSIFNNGLEYYFHGTSQCNALFIFLDGLKDTYFSNGMLGRGFYMTDNIQKTYFYGNYVFVGTISYKNKYIIPRTSPQHLQEIIQNINLDLNSNDVLKYEGIYDRFGNENEKLGDFYDASSFNEYLVPSSNQIQLKYILQVDKNDQLTQFNTLLRYKTICIIDVDSKFISNYHECRNVFEPDDMVNLRKLIIETNHLVYIDANFQLILKNMHMKNEYVLNDNNFTFEKQLLKTQIQNLFFYYDYHLTPGEYVVALNIYKNNELLTINDLKENYLNILYSQGDLGVYIHNDVISLDIKFIIGRRCIEGNHIKGDNFNVLVYSKPINMNLDQ